MEKGIYDYEVVSDTKVNHDLAPAGLMKVWGKVRVEEVGPSAFDKINLRRITLMLWDSRHPLPDSKISRRSRRRWRGKGGVWLFDPNLQEHFVKALIAVQTKSYAKVGSDA